MLIKQMSVFVENTTGRLAELARILSENEIYLSFEDDLACTAEGNKYGTFVKE